MCRNIKTLFNFDPPATEEEIKAASLGATLAGSDTDPHGYLMNIVPGIDVYQPLTVYGNADNGDLFTTAEFTPLFSVVHTTPTRTLGRFVVHSVGEVWRINGDDVVRDAARSLLGVFATVKNDSDIRTLYERLQPPTSRS